MTEPEWLAWTRELQAIAGLAFSQNPYDRERYLMLRGRAADDGCAVTRSREVIRPVPIRPADRLLDDTLDREICQNRWRRAHNWRTPQRGSVDLRRRSPLMLRQIGEQLLD